MGKCPDAKEEINHAAIIIGGLNNKWNCQVAIIFQRLYGKHFQLTRTHEQLAQKMFQ
jgi:hypothetical protein